MCPVVAAQVALDPIPRRLSCTWRTYTPEWAAAHGFENELLVALAGERRSKLTLDIEPLEEMVRLTVVHDDFEAAPVGDEGEAVRFFVSWTPCAPARRRTTSAALAGREIRYTPVSLDEHAAEAAAHRCASSPTSSDRPRLPIGDRGQECIEPGCESACPSTRTARFAVPI